MKLIILLSAVFGVGIAVFSNPIEHDLEELQNLIFNAQPTSESIYRRIRRNPDLQYMVSYLQSPHWAQLISQAESHPDVQKLFAKMLSAGVDLRGIMTSTINNPQKAVAVAQAFKNFFQKAENGLTQQELIALLKETFMSTSKGRRFYRELSNVETGRIVRQASWVSSVSNIMEIVIKLGIKVKDLLPLIFQLFGWK